VAGHPIEGLMSTAMDSIKQMVDVNTIVGDAVQAPDGSVIIPISKVAFGFAAGGGEYSGACIKETVEGEDEGNDGYCSFPFAGGSGAGVSICPVAFMVVGNGQIRLLPVNVNSTVNKVLDLLPDFMSKIEAALEKKPLIKKEAKNNGAKILKGAKEDKETSEASKLEKDDAYEDDD